jgi:hypothetical protein
MEQIIICVRDSKKADTLLKFLKTLDYVENIVSANLPKTDEPKKQGKRISLTWPGFGLTARFPRKVCANRPGQDAYDSLRHQHPD